jgi:hypothetical protein
MTHLVYIRGPRGIEAQIVRDPEFLKTAYVIAHIVGKTVVDDADAGLSVDALRARYPLQEAA